MPGSCRTVIPSTPGAPLLRTTARNAASMFSGSQIASIRLAVGAGLSGSDAAVTTSTSRASGRGASPRHRQVQCELEWRSRCGHEMSELLALSFNPSSGTVLAFSRRSGLLRPLLTSASRSGRLAAASVRPVFRLDTAQISRGKSRSLPRTPAGFTAMALDGYGLCGFLPARPTISASYPVAVRRVAISLHASFRRSLAVPPLRFTRASPPSGCTGDFHPQTAGHARHTGGRRLRRCLLGLLDRGWPQHPWDVAPGRGNGPFNRARTRGEASRFKGRDIVTIHRVVLPMCPVQSVTHVPG